MVGADTNIVVRFLVADDPAQAARARALIEAGDVFVSDTVLLETEWILGSVYDVPKKERVVALRRFAGLAGVRVGEAAAVARALDWAEAGMDFADALHLAKAAHCERFVSFDGAFVRKARRVGGVEVVQG